MSYDLSIDIGTSYTAAAIRDSNGNTEPFRLGRTSNFVPSMVYLTEDGVFEIGDVAKRKAATDPRAAATRLTRRIGDSTPIILRSSPFSAEQLYARTLENVHAKVVEHMGEEPRRVVAVHPHAWGPYKIDLFGQALRMSNLATTTITAPIAAAWTYVTRKDLAAGSRVAMFDLGGGTLDIAVVEKTPDGFEMLGQGGGAEQLGGIDIDSAIIDWVRGEVGEAWPAPSDDPRLAASLMQLEDSCSEAKEILSSEPDVLIPVHFPDVDRMLTLTTEHLDQITLPIIDSAIDALGDAFSNAEVSGAEVTTVLLGGCSRIPAIRTQIAERFGSRVAANIDPTHAVAFGAALSSGAA